MTLEVFDVIKNKRKNKKKRLLVKKKAVDLSSLVSLITNNYTSEGTGAKVE